MRQCKNCPWKKSTNPHDIPRGYSVEKHKALSSTIAEPGDLNLTVPMRLMACHNTHDAACVGWVHHQLGEGNNIRLRILALDGRFKNYRVVGPQHERFEDTLPKEAADEMEQEVLRSGTR
jgi:hypothetical protein